jgi:hypothetical protein
MYSCGDYKTSVMAYDETCAIIKKYRGKDKDVVIPEAIKGRQVVSIYANAFKDNVFIETVFIPNSVKTIGNDAFRNCTSLREVHFSDSLSSIYTHAFYGCTSLVSVSLPEMGSDFEGFDAIADAINIVPPTGNSRIDSIVAQAKERYELARLAEEEGLRRDSIQKEIYKAHRLEQEEYQAEQAKLREEQEKNRQALMAMGFQLENMDVDRLQGNAAICKHTENGETKYDARYIPEERLPKRVEDLRYVITYTTGRVFNGTYDDGSNGWQPVYHFVITDLHTSRTKELSFYGGNAPQVKTHIGDASGIGPDEDTIMKDIAAELDQWNSN